MATPRNLDPKFTETEAPEEATNETPADVKGEDLPDEPDGGWISHVRRWTDNEGKKHERVDRIPMPEWNAYAKKWDL